LTASHIIQLITAS